MVLRPWLVHVLLRTVRAMPGETTTLGSRVWYGAAYCMWRFLTCSARRTSDHVAGCGSWLQAVRAIAGTGVPGCGGLRSRRRALTSFVEPEERKQLHEGRISGIRFQHFQMMITKLLQKHWKEDRQE